MSPDVTSISRQLATAAEIARRRAEACLEGLSGTRVVRNYSCKKRERQTELSVNGSARFNR